MVMNLFGVVTIVTIALLAPGTESGGLNGREVTQRHEMPAGTTLAECERLARYINTESNKGPHKFSAHCIENK